MSEECVQCGKCCFMTLKNGTKIRCRYLVKLKNKYFCRIYKNRLGVTTYKDKHNHFKCAMRTQLKRIIIGCPQNKDIET